MGSDRYKVYMNLAIVNILRFFSHNIRLIAPKAHLAFESKRE